MSKSNDVYDYVIGRLTSAEYGFGEPLLVKALSTETGASRQPIMAALSRLSTEGFVKIVPQVGCQIISPSKTEIEDFFMLFQQLEGLLADLAAQRRNDEELLELNIVQQRIRSLVDGDNPSPELYVSLNRKFHQAIHGMAHSPLLDRKQRNNFNMCDFFITQSVGFASFMAVAADEHDGIVTAITAQDASQAKAEAEAHIASIGKAVLAGL